MTEPNNIGLLGSGRQIVLDDGAVTEIVSAPRGAEAVSEWHRHRHLQEPCHRASIRSRHALYDEMPSPIGEPGTGGAPCRRVPTSDPVYRGEGLLRGLIPF